jgi:tRNA pseudouridine38-40 synthase
VKLLLDISFLGTSYCGYQVQPNVPTVQGCLNDAAKQLFGFDCDVVGCSRTDSGVHAKQFFVALSKKGKNSIETEIPTERVAQALSVYLPKEISVNSVTLVQNEFHPRYDVRYKEYMYCIWNNDTRDPFLYDRVWHYPRKIDDTAFENMRLAAEALVGTHDFSSYMASNSSVDNTVRTVYHTRLERDGDMIRFYIHGDGFLYNMVRIIVGTLIGVAENKISYTDIPAITASHDRSRAGMTAPPQGLYLNQVIY